MTDDYYTFDNKLVEMLTDQNTSEIIQEIKKEREAEQVEHFKYVKSTPQTIRAKTECDLDRERFKKYIDEAVNEAMQCGDYGRYYDKLMTQDPALQIFNADQETQVDKPSSSSFDFNDYNQQRNAWEKRDKSAEVKSAATATTTTPSHPPTLSTLMTPTKATDFTTSVYNTLHKNTPSKIMIASDGLTRVIVPTARTPYVTKVELNMKPKCLANGHTFEEITNNDINEPTHRNFISYINRSTQPRSAAETAAILRQKNKYYRNK